MDEFEVDILIGADYIWQFMLDHVVRGEQGYGPVATLTRFGYVLNGPVEIPSTNEHSSNIIISHVLKTDNIVVDSDKHLINELHKFWDIESMGIKSNEQELTCSENPLEGKIHFNQKLGKYEISLPFKEDHPVIADNYQVARKRLESLLKRLNSKPDVLHQYNEVISEQLNSGVVEKVEDTELCSAPVGSVYYNPHREVVREERQTTKLRVVYDASSKQNGEVSLNDCLEPGPNLVPLIFDVLLRLRAKRIALIGDLEKAFLNIIIQENDRNFLRFLWYDNVFEKDPELATLRFSRLVFGLTSSPYVLNATVRHHLENYRQSDNEFVQTVEKSLYIDDFAFSLDTEEESFELYRKLKLCFASGGFNMRKWASNSDSLIERIELAENMHSKTANSKESNVIFDDDETFTKSISNTVCNGTESKILGMPWNRNNDKFVFDFSEFIEAASSTVEVTKRNILRTTARFFDPLGVLSPVILPLKMIFQQLCKLKTAWDEKLPDDICNNWLKIVNNIANTTLIEFPRSLMGDIISNDAISIQLHGFSDASQYAYGACVYFRVESSSKLVISRLICAKTKVAPMKGETIPRLELMAAVTLSRLIKSVHNALISTINLESIFCWTDSQVVLHWVLGNKEHKQVFVRNRVHEICDLTEKKNWRYCPTSNNPADIASRGIDCSKMQSNEFWWNGPQFLENDSEFWPVNEIAPSQQIEINTNVVVTENNDQLNLNKIIPCVNYSSFIRLIRVTALVLKFVAILKGKVKNLQTDISDDFLSKVNEAKIMWHLEVQKVFDLSGNDKEIRNNLGCFVDKEGIIRVGGRLQNASISYNSKHPVLLPRQHHFTKLVIWHSHLTVKHNGVNETLAEVRSNYWITKGRQIVKSLIAKCSRCKAIHGKPYETPNAPPLPAYRVSEDAAFTNVAVDFAGPLYVKDIYTKTDRMNKCYIALFSCANTRAIHLELVPDLFAETFIRALKRFTARRGLSKLIVSDNGKTFLDKNVQMYAQNMNIRWIFNVPTASWWGGWWEICVKLTKKCLRKTLGNAKLSYEELETALIETEGIINSRPLTYVGEEISEPPLTPSCLVIGRRILDQSESLSMSSDKTSLTKRARYLELIIEHFRQRFKKEYIPSLHERHRCLKNPKRVIQVGDIVHIFRDKVPKHTWAMGKVVKLLTGRDGLVRAAEIKTLDKSRRVIYIKRPIQRLYPLEVNANEENSTEIEHLNGQKEHEPSITMVRDEDIREHIANII
ncbi:uncharacterized protein LOC135687567 [Rhopilema esculentum]|uniref:uncharacterized protein LOC135687567 n=1 Tax=Rhopilema esculentum TaxID=499914 RepID=UPI0031E0DF7B